MSNISIEEVKNFWNNRPCNIRHSNKEFGSKEYFDEVEKRKYFVEPHIPTFADFQKWNNKKVLEIGCGIGTDSINFAKSGAKYTGFELSKESLDITKKRFNTFNLEGNFYNGNAEELNKIVPEDKYDLIYSFGVIHHSPEPEKIIENVKQYMHKDSEFKLMLYSKYSWKSFMILLKFDQPEAQYGCPIANVYSFKEIEDLLKDFKITEIKKDHIFQYVIKKYKKYEYDIVPWFKWMPKQMFKSLEQRAGWHTLITCKLK